MGYTKQISGLAEVKKANRQWFAPENQEFFNDLEYGTLWSGTGALYLWRRTTGFSDMFDGIKKVYYRINALDQETLKIGKLEREIFKSMDEVRDYLEGI